MTWTEPDNGSKINKAWINMKHKKEHLIKLINSYLFNIPIVHLWFFVVFFCGISWLVVVKIIRGFL